MKLIDNLSDAPKMYVMWVLAAIALANGVWAEIPADVKAEFPQHFIHYVTVVLAVAGKVARVVKQFQMPSFADTEPTADEAQK